MPQYNQHICRKLIAVDTYAKRECNSFLIGIGSHCLKASKIFLMNSLIRDIPIQMDY